MRPRTTLGLVVAILALIGLALASDACGLKSVKIDPADLCKVLEAAGQSCASPAPSTLPTFPTGASPQPPPSAAPSPVSPTSVFANNPLCVPTDRAPTGCHCGSYGDLKCANGDCPAGQHYEMVGDHSDYDWGCNPDPAPAPSAPPASPRPEPSASPLTFPSAPPSAPPSSAPPDECVPTYGGDDTKVYDTVYRTINDGTPGEDGLPHPSNKPLADRYLREVVDAPGGLSDQVKAAMAGEAGCAIDDQSCIVPGGEPAYPPFFERLSARLRRPPYSLCAGRTRDADDGIYVAQRNPPAWAEGLLVGMHVIAYGKGKLAWGKVEGDDKAVIQRIGHGSAPPTADPGAPPSPEPTPPGSGAPPEPPPPGSPLPVGIAPERSSIHPGQAVELRCSGATADHPFDRPAFNYASGRSAKPVPVWVETKPFTTPTPPGRRPGHYENRTPYCLAYGPDYEVSEDGGTARVAVHRLQDPFDSCEVLISCHLEGYAGTSTNAIVKVTR